MRASLFSLELKKLTTKSSSYRNVPCQQNFCEHIRERTFPVDHLHHGFLIDFRHRAVGHRVAVHAERLCRKATFTEEIALRMPFVATLPRCWLNNSEVQSG